MIMKKVISIVLALALVLSLGALAACGSKKEDKVITVGASSTPHAEILEQVKKTLADEGYELKIVVYDDYVLPNTALADGEIDANYFQHTPYLNNFNAENGTHIVAAAAIHVEPLGIYGGKQTSLDAIKNK